MSYDSHMDTLEHIRRVQSLLGEIETNADRLGYSEELQRIFSNTIDEMGWGNG